MTCLDPVCCLESLQTKGLERGVGDDDDGDVWVVVFLPRQDPIQMEAQAYQIRHLKGISLRHRPKKLQQTLTVVKFWLIDNILIVYLVFDLIVIILI